MEIVFSGDDEAFINEQVRAGKFKDAQSVVAGALAQLRHSDLVDAELARLERGFDQEWLKKEVAIGVDEANRGLVAPLDIEEIKRDGRKLLAQRSVVKA